MKFDETTKDQEDHNADLKAAIQYGRSQQNPTSRQGSPRKGNPVSREPELPPSPPSPPPRVVKKWRGLIRSGLPGLRIS